MSFLLQIGEYNIPEELVERPAGYGLILGCILFFALCIISFARYSRPALFRNVFVAWLKIQNLRTYLRESLPLNKRESLLLILNYFVSGGIVVYLFLGEFEIENLVRIYVSIAIPLTLFLLNMLSLLLTGFISGELKLLREPIYMKMIGVQILGLFFFLGALVWILNFNLVKYVIIGLFILISFEMISRLFKSVLVVYAKGVSWFYIILYLCTLEILPLFVAYYVIARNFRELI